MKILFSNLGYATGIDGSLQHHAFKLLRHAYQTAQMQQAVLEQFRRVLDVEKPDLSCLVELDQGSIHSGHYNQIRALTSDQYPVFDIADKYGPTSALTKMVFHTGKSNGFIARRPYAFERLYFSNGTKRLIYKISLKSDLTLFFAHYSLSAKVRALQFSEIRYLMDKVAGEVILLGDFNIRLGLKELAPLIQDKALHLLNSPLTPTFRFHRWHQMLDLCLCTPGLEHLLSVRVIPQPFSDHSALLVCDGQP